MMKKKISDENKGQNDEEVVMHEFLIKGQKIVHQLHFEHEIAWEFVVNLPANIIAPHPEAFKFNR